MSHSCPSSSTTAWPGPGVAASERSVRTWSARGSTSRARAPAGSSTYSSPPPLSTFTPPPPEANGTGSDTSNVAPSMRATAPSVESVT